MTSKTPVIRNFFIEDSRGNGFLNSNELQWDGTWNQTMYAGNVYHLILEASDDNGWRDVDFFKAQPRQNDGCRRQSSGHEHLVLPSKSNRLDRQPAP